MPKFPGGMKGMDRFIKSNLRYPKPARKAGVQGTVLVTFMMGSAGVVHSPEIVESLNKECDEEVIRLISQMPRWKPGAKAPV